MRVVSRFHYRRKISPRGIVVAFVNASYLLFASGSFGCRLVLRQTKLSRQSHGKSLGMMHRLDSAVLGLRASEAACCIRPDLHSQDWFSRDLGDYDRRVCTGSTRTRQPVVKSASR